MSKNHIKNLIIKTNVQRGIFVEIWRFVKSLLILLLEEPLRGSPHKLTKSDGDGRIDKTESPVLSSNLSDLLDPLTDSVKL